jgi:hypothetical protein
MNAVVDFPIKPEARPYLDAFHRVAGEPDWLARFREQGLSRFAELGFPTRKSESWRYLDLRSLEQQPLLPAVTGAAPNLDAARNRLAALGLPEPGTRLVIVDGRFAEELSAVSLMPNRNCCRNSLPATRRTRSRR